MKSICLASILLVFLVGCKKENPGKEPKEPLPVIKNYSDVLKISSKGYYGAVFYSANRYNTGPGADVMYEAQADFFTSKDFNTSNRVSVGILKIGKIFLSSKTSNGNSYYFENAERTSALNSAQFGTHVGFSITGDSLNGFDPDSINFYVPDEIILTGPFSSAGPLPTHSKSSPLNVAWNADADNDSIIIVLVYEGTLSHSIDSGLTDITMSVVVPTIDDASHSINSSVFSGFPVGGMVTLYVGRTGCGVFSTNNREVPVYAYTVASQLFKLTN